MTASDAAAADRPNGGSTPARIPRAAVLQWALPTAMVAVGVLAMVLVLGGGAPEAPIAGLPDAGYLTGWGLPISRLLSDLASFASVGLVLAAAFLLPAPQGELRGLRLRALRLVTWTALIWAIAVAAQTLFTISDQLFTPAGDLGLTSVRSYLVQTLQGRAFVAQFAVALALAGWARSVFTTRGATWVLALAVLGLTPPALTGHSASSGSHDLAVASLLVHIIAASLWVGGVAALAWAATEGTGTLVRAVPRFSALAAWCLVAVGVSGVANAAARLRSPGQLFDSWYGGLVLAKVAALLLLGAFGYRHRRSTVARLSAAVDADKPVRWAAGRAFLGLAAAELTVMAATVALAVGLSRTPTPLGPGTLPTPAEELLGRPLPAAPTWSRLAWGWEPDGFALTFLALAVALYTTGVWTMHRRGDRWPVLRSVSWGVGLLVVAWATVGGLGRYSQVLFSAHMGAHMVLSMVAPIFLVLGAPVTLALRTLPGTRVPGEQGPRQVLLAVLHSRVLRVVTSPLVAFPLFVGSLYALYFTDLFPTLMEHHLGHVAMDGHFLAVGSLFFYVLVGIDPAPRRLHPLARIGMLFAAMPFHAFFSIAVMSSSTVLAGDYYAALRRPFSTDLLDDQKLGGGIGWALGEVPILLVLMAIFVRWVADDDREARRGDRAEDRRLAAEALPTDAEADAPTGIVRPHADRFAPHIRQ